MKSKATPSVAIIGGGIAGCAAAIALTRAGHQVLVLEQSRSRAPAIGETLPGAAKPILRALGAWDAFAADGHLPSPGTVSIWGGSDPAMADSILDRNGQGWQVDRARLGQLLRRAAVAAGAVLWEDAPLAAAERRKRRWRLRVAAEGEAGTVVVDRVIDASGRRGSFATMAGATRNYLDNLVCRHARFGRGSAGRDRDSRTWVEAVEGGWWYSVLLPGGDRAAAFLTDGDLLPEAVLSAGGFVKWLRQTEWIRRPIDKHGRELLGSPRTLAARSSRLKPAGGAGWVAAGDAALSFDPLAGQGMLLALLTGLRAAQAVMDGSEADYFRQLDSIWDGFAKMRYLTYAAEMRWPASVFWERRARKNALPQSREALPATSSMPSGTPTVW